MAKKENSISLTSLSNDLIPRVFKPVDPIKGKKTNVQFLLNEILSRVVSDHSDAYNRYVRAYFSVLLNGSADAVTDLVHYLIWSKHFEIGDRYFNLTEKDVKIYTMSYVYPNNDGIPKTTDANGKIIRVINLGYALRSNTSYFAVDYSSKDFKYNKLVVKFEKDSDDEGNSFYSGGVLEDKGKEVIRLVKKYTEKIVEWSPK